MPQTVLPLALISTLSTGAGVSTIASSGKER